MRSFQLNTLFFLFFFIVVHVTAQSSFQHPVIRAWGDSRNSPLTTTSNSPVAAVISRNVTEIVATSGAVAMRLSTSNEEAESAIEQFKNYIYIDSTKKLTISAARPLATYVIWGDQRFGGTIPSDIFTHFSQPTSNSRQIQANDICALHDAFVAIFNGRVACWGNSATCTGWRTVFGGNTALQATMVYCPYGGVAAIVMLTAPHPIYGGRISIFGSPSFGGTFPANTELRNQLARIATEAPVQVVGNQRALAVLFQGGRVFAWGDPNFGGVTPTDNEVLFVQALVANDIGFSALTTTQKIFTWGGSLQALVPRRIQQGGDALVQTIYGGGECFAALLSDGGVATWGRGEQNYCAEEGASNSDLYVSYLRVRNSLSKDIVKLVLNEHAFAAISRNNEVITWGRVDSGGSTLSAVDDAKWARPETLVASCCAFAFIRQDGFIVTWGAANAGGFLDRAAALHGASKIVAARYHMAALVPNGWFLVWGGEFYGFFTLDNDVSEFRLDAPVVGLIHAVEALAIVMGTPCQMSDWGEWSNCSAKCGGGHKSRSRTLVVESVNTLCYEPMKDLENCNTYPCLVEQGDGSFQLPSVGSLIGIGIGTLLILALAIYGIFVCCYKQPAPETL